MAVKRIRKYPHKRVGDGEFNAITAKRVLLKIDSNGNQIITALPPRRRKKSSELQKDGMSRFREAVRYAKMVLQDPKKVARYKRKLKGHRNVFQAALSEYLSGKV